MARGPMCVLDAVRLWNVVVALPHFCSPLRRLSRRKNNSFSIACARLVPTANGGSFPKPFLGELAIRSGPARLTCGWAIELLTFAPLLLVQCSNFYRKLIRVGELKDNNYLVDPVNGSVHYLFTLRANDGGLGRSCNFDYRYLCHET